jgi:hypothetical protein
MLVISGEQADTGLVVPTRLGLVLVVAGSTRDPGHGS